MSLPAENRERVLRAATASFLQHGYGSSVDYIARRAGVAKQTVYHHFPSKDALFAEVARGMVRSVLTELEGEPSANFAGFRADLLRFALAYRKRVLGAQGVAAFRTVVPEVTRFPRLAKSMYQASAGEAVRRLAAVLERAMQEGRLRRDDPEFAAEMLHGMLVGIDRIKRLFGVLSAAEASDTRRAARIVDCFLKAFAHD
jgi:TetR/AcrR family transcriptional repressor of mexJK operon